MIGINFFSCFALCTLAVWIESLRSVAAMRKQAQASLARFEKSGGESGQDLFHNQMEQAAPWAELLTPIDLSESDKTPALPRRQSKLDISLSTPWLYLSLLLLFWLLLL